MAAPTNGKIHTSQAFIAIPSNPTVPAIFIYHQPSIQNLL
jgi:hypothetical protein